MSRILRSWASQGAKHVFECISWIKEAKPVHLRAVASPKAASQQRDLSNFKDKGLVAEAILLGWLNEDVQELIQYADELARYDANTEKITRFLRQYVNGVAFQSLGKEDGGWRRDVQTRKIFLNRESVQKLLEPLEDKEQSCQRVAVLLFLCHEVSHEYQNLGMYPNVKQLKQHPVWGRERVGELDLRSDFLTAHCLSLFFNLRENGVNRLDRYIHWFYRVWVEVSRPLLAAYPAGDKKDKQQRVFGYLLMSELLCEHYSRGWQHMPFSAELWPYWDDDLCCLSVLSAGCPIVPGCSVDPLLMRKILGDIAAGNYNQASAGIAKVWRSVPIRISTGIR